MKEAGRGGVLLALPAGLVLLGLFAAPLAALLVVSFWSVARFKLVPGFTGANYVQTITDYGPLLARTLGMALVVGVITTGLALAFAWAIRFRLGRFGDALLFATLLTIFGGYLVKIYAWKSILGSDGLISSGLLALGLVQEPVRGLIYNQGAVVVALTHALLPFAVLPIVASLRNVADAAVEAARDLGAGGRTVALRVVLPQCRAGLLAAFTLTFLATAGDYVTPLLLGGSSGAMLGQFIGLQFSARFNWPLGAAMAFTLFAAALLVVALAWAAFGRERRA